ncbi:MAG TPA: hypothetical protein PKY81_04190 [bacterium]|mgnify:FL=1|nr:hypothetical protein [bacterium]
MPLKKYFSLIFHYAGKFANGMAYPVYYYEITLKKIILISSISYFSKLILKFYFILGNDYLDSYYFFIPIPIETYPSRLVKEVAASLIFRAAAIELAIICFLYLYAYMKLKKHYSEESLSAIFFPYMFSIIGCLPLIDFIIQYLSLWFTTVQLNELSGELSFSKKINSFLIFVFLIFAIKFLGFLVWPI